MQYRTKYTDEFVEKVRNGATAEELGLTKNQFEHIVRYRIRGIRNYAKNPRQSTGKTGRHSWHSKPIGSERFDKDGYILVKVAYPRVERRKQFIEWEKHNPPTDKKTECLIFLDGDKTNCNIDNLFKIKRKYLGGINRYAPVGMPVDLRKAAIMSAILYLDAKDSERKKRYIGKRSVEKKPVENQMVINLHEQGFNNHQIAEKTGRDICVVRWVIRKYFLKKEALNEVNKIKRAS